MKTIFFPILLISFLVLSACNAAPTQLPTTIPVEQVALPTDTLEPVATATSEPSPTPSCHAYFWMIGFSEDGGGLYGLVTVDGQQKTWLQLLDLADLTAKAIYEIDQFAVAPVLSPDRKTLAWAIPPASIQLIDLQTGMVFATLNGHTDIVNDLVFSPDGTKLYSGSNDRSVIAWDMSGNMLRTFQPTGADGFASDVLGLGISPDGGTLVTIPFDGHARAWDTARFESTGEFQGVISGGYNGAKAIFSPDGQYLVIGLGAGPGSASMWQVGEPDKFWSGSSFADFDFSADNRYFAYGQMTPENQSQLIISSPDTKTAYQTIQQDDMLLKLLFSPDGTRLFVASATKFSIRNVSDGTLIKDYVPVCP